MNTKALVKDAETYFEARSKELRGEYIPYDSSKIIFAFDRDSFPEEHFNTAINMAQSRYPGCHVAWSNESFELWLRLHFEYVSAALPRHQHNDRLTEIFRKHGVLTSRQNYAKHGKNIDNIFGEIKACGGSLEAAMNYAKKLLKSQDISSPAVANPMTMVFKAVEALKADAPKP